MRAWIDTVDRRRHGSAPTTRWHGSARSSQRARALALGDARARRGSARTPDRARAPWLAAEACLHLEGRALAGDERAWRAGVVRHHAHTFGRDEGLSDEAAEAALAHWRWPNAHPPLSVVAAGAGALRPIESESAWANAVRAHAHGGWEGWESALAWARKTRAGEEETRGRTIRTIESQALGWAETRWAGSAVQTLHRWAREWDANERLEGDGTRIAPALATSGEGRAHSGGRSPSRGRGR